MVKIEKNTPNLQICTVVPQRVKKITINKKLFLVQSFIELYQKTIREYSSPMGSDRCSFGEFIQRRYYTNTRLSLSVLILKARLQIKTFNSQIMSKAFKIGLKNFSKCKKSQKVLFGARTLPKNDFEI